MIKTVHFKIWELVDKQIYDVYKENAFKFFDDRLLLGADLLRKRYGVCTINNWHEDLPFMWSGLRTSSCTIGAKLSAHRAGKALDMKFRDVPTEEIRQDIKSGKFEEIKGYINRIELDVTWLHVDTFNETPITWVKP